MLDIKFIRENSNIVKEAVKNKKVDIDIDQLLKLDSKRRELLSPLESLKAQHNKISKLLSIPGSDDEPEHTENKFFKDAHKLKKEIKKSEKELSKIEEQFKKLMYAVPNIPSADTPIGPDETGNKVLRQIGKIPVFDFKPKEHWELGEALNIIDNERASKVSGTRFSYLKGGIALLEFALIQYVMSILINEEVLRKIIKDANLRVSTKPFTPVIPPVMVRSEVMEKMARLEPKKERYYIESDDLYLVGSAEHTLGPMHMGETLREDDLPIRYIGFSTAFRREAGSYGTDTKGILRVHQFDKLEMESFTLPDNSMEEQNFIIAIQEYFMKELSLPYQAVAICTGDMGGPDTRQIDIETWMPGQNKYRETHTSDLMTDYQSRRLNTKVKRKNNKSDFVHMNDATAVAGRTLIAILENYQTKNGTVKIPDVLQKYMHGQKEIK